MVRRMSEPDRPARVSAAGVIGPGVAVQTVKAPVMRPASVIPAVADAVLSGLSKLGGRGSATISSTQAVMSFNAESDSPGINDANTQPAKVAPAARKASGHWMVRLSHAVATAETSRLRLRRIGTPAAGPIHSIRKGPQITLNPVPAATCTAEPIRTNIVHAIMVEVRGGNARVRSMATGTTAEARR